MEDLLSKIYDKVAYYEKDSIQLGKEFDNVVNEVLEPLKDSKTEAEIEEIREMMYQVTYYGQKNGFVMGVRFMTKFFLESLGSEDVSVLTDDLSQTRR